MAHIQYGPHPDGGPARRIIINGHDFSDETFAGVELVEVGDDPEFAEVGFRVTFAVSRLDLGDDENVTVTDHFREIAQRVRSVAKVSDPA